jgi:endonuclease/exonuclease/phosphatase family metal-dependent hydrolase
MQLTTVQWNIGGGKILAPGADPTKMASYSEDGLDYVVDYLKTVTPDIITLQEIHINDSLNQAEYIAEKLGMSYWVSDAFADSHIEEGQKLGQAIISKYPISDKESQLYVNLNKEAPSDDGSTTWHSHDKGLTRCSIDLGEVMLCATTTHLTPFRVFNIDVGSEDGRCILDDVEAKLANDSAYQLIQGDFNLDFSQLAPLFPTLINDTMEEIPLEDGTTPKDRRYDHILYKGIQLTASTINKEALTDHYPVVAEFEF